MAYAFGDTDLARKRLELLARVYRDSTRTFLRDAVRGRPTLAVDLGCGPGLTTRLVAETLGCPGVVGLDFSESFIEVARQTPMQGVSYRRHDATSAPLPVAEIDLIFCRFLMTHLKHPEERVVAWIGELRPGGRLLIEEVEWIDARIPVFSLYLEIVAELLVDQGHELYLGPFLDRLGGGPEGAKSLSRVWTQPVSNRDAAGMFSMNLQTWKDSDYVRAHHPDAEIAALQRELTAVSEGPAGPSEITWGLRQIAFERVQPA